MAGVWGRGLQSRTQQCSGTPVTSRENSFVGSNSTFREEGEPEGRRQGMPWRRALLKLHFCRKAPSR